MSSLMHAPKILRSEERFHPAASNTNSFRPHEILCSNFFPFPTRCCSPSRRRRSCEGELSTHDPFRRILVLHVDRGKSSLPRKAVPVFPENCSPAINLRTMRTWSFLVSSLALLCSSIGTVTGLGPRFRGASEGAEIQGTSEDQIEAEIQGDGIPIAESGAEHGSRSASFRGTGQFDLLATEEDVVPLPRQVGRHIL